MAERTDFKERLAALRQLLAQVDLDEDVKADLENDINIIDQQSARQNPRIKRIVDCLENIKDCLDQAGITGHELDRLIRQINTGGGAYIGGDVFASEFVGRDKIINIGEDPAKTKKAEQAYRDELARRCNRLPLGESSAATKPEQIHLNLKRVYIQLDTRRQASVKAITTAINAAQRGNFPGLSDQPMEHGMKRDEEARQLSALEAAIIHRHLVLLGDPGSGKTTFINFLTYALATRQWEELSDWPEHERELLPVHIVLRDFASWLQAGKHTPKQGNAGALLWKFIKQSLQNSQLEDALPVVHEALRDKRVIVLLDGLDEVPPEPALLKTVRQSVEKFIERLHGNRFLITCRILAYREPQWQLTIKIPSLELAQFDQPKIEQFIHSWYSEAGPQWHYDDTKIQAKAEALHSELQRRPELQELAPNPLLLTIMAIVHISKTALPRKLVLLYQDAVEVLLMLRDRQRGIEAKTIHQLLEEIDCDLNDLLRKVLEPLAFKAHESRQALAGQGDSAGIHQNDLLTRLENVHPEQNWEWVRHMLNSLHQRSSLLLERKGQVFSFPHRTFQEYLAGVHLAREDRFDQRAAELAGTDSVYWRQAILYATGYQVHHGGRDADARALVEELCPVAANDNQAGWRKVRLAAEVLLEIGIPRIEEREQGHRLLKQVRERLTSLVERGKLSAKERAQAGDVLGQLGDPRFDSELFYLPCRYKKSPEPFAGFIQIPAGPFVMGDSNPKKHTIDYDYWLARYPVTVSQYGEFISAGHKTPKNWNDQLRFSNRAVVSVSWNDARAYCDWLNEKLTAHKAFVEWFKQGYRIRLPNEDEWEKAARCGDDRVYPWGNQDWDEEKANVGDSDIGHATPVGIYPNGATPTGIHAGIHDFAGSVWEWTITRDNNSRVLRGGCWANDQRNARCAARFRNPPTDAYTLVGFRLALSLVLDSGS